MRLYPRYTVNSLHEPAGATYRVLDTFLPKDGDSQVIEVLNNFKAAQDRALELEAQVCDECGIEPRAPGTSSCVRCYVQRKL